MLRAQADFLEQAPCRRAVEVEAGTHNFHLQRPEWTASVILAFLSDPTPCAAVTP
jgi:pimeloyl-ACP methyl ester carboxylesterase